MRRTRLRQDDALLKGVFYVILDYVSSRWII